MDKKLRDEAVRMALDIVKSNPLHITACLVEGCSPDGSGLQCESVDLEVDR